MEKISVIVPIYKPPLDMLVNCLRSWVNQDYENYEIILVNDGVFIDLMLFCQEYGFNSGLFRIIKQENSGVSSARNAGIAVASGDYICFCDADDYVSADFLSTLKSCMATADLGICGVTEQCFPVISSEVSINAFFASPCIYNKLQYTNFCVNKIYKTSIIKNNNIRFEESIKLGEDALFVADYLNYCLTVKTINKDLYHYMPNDNSAVHSYEPQFWDWEKVLIAKQFKQFYSEDLGSKNRQYMKFWAFCKIRQVLNYYAQCGIDSRTRCRVFNELRYSDVYKFLWSFAVWEDNQFFSFLDKLQLVMWKTLGSWNSVKIKSGIRKLILGIKRIIVSA